MRMMSRRLKSRLASRRGAELIEFALVLPLLLLVVLGIVDFGFLFQRMEVVTNAAREGARIAVLPGYSVADAQTRACNFLLNGGVPITGACPNSDESNDHGGSQFLDSDLGGGKTPVGGVQVVVTYTSRYLFLTPLLSWFGGSISIGADPRRGSHASGGAVIGGGASNPTGRNTVLVNQEQST